MTDLRKLKICVYDIETMYLVAKLWRLGEQRVGPHQLSKHRDMTEILCITYVFNDGKPPKELVFKYGQKDSMTDMIREFDKILAGCDVIIGKNSDRFDNKHINTQRLMSGLPGNPEWLDRTDDLEKQMRKYFNMPSQSLDFWSKKFNLGGKIKMEWQDWEDIEAGHTISILSKEVKGKALDAVSKYLYHGSAKKIVDLGLVKLKKMSKYGRKDVADTLKLILKLAPHVTFKFNRSAYKGSICCRRCGSTKIQETYTYLRGKTKYQYFKCLDHAGSAGKIALRKDGTYNQAGVLE